VLLFLLWLWAMVDDINGLGKWGAGSEKGGDMYISISQ
jgi:hypothetical protein